MDYDAGLSEKPEMLKYYNISQNLRNQVRAYDLLIPPIGTLIIVTNLIVVMSSGLIIKKNQRPLCTYLFLGNVAMADVVTSMAVVFGVLFPKPLITEGMCAAHLGLIVSGTLTSNFSVCLVAVDRFIHIIHGIKYPLWMYASRAKLMIKVSWIIGMTLGFLPALGWRNPLKNTMLCWYILLAPKNLIIITAIIGVFLPVFVVIVLYSAILCKALKKVLQLKRVNQRRLEHLSKISKTNESQTKASETSKDTNNRVADKSNSNHTGESENKNEPTRFKSFFKMKQSSNIDENIQLHERRRNPSKWKAIKVVVFTTCSFFCTWMPYFITSLIYVNCDPDKTPVTCKKMEYAMASPLAILGFMNSMLNPIIYAWWHSGFRKTFQTMCWNKNSLLNNENRF